MEKILNFLKSIINYFSPSDFTEIKGVSTSYVWALNQTGHMVLSFYLCKYLFSSYYLILFWIIWETRHYVIGRNLRDCLEDLVFESLGIALFMIGVAVEPFLFITLAVGFIIRLIEEKT